MNPLKNLKSDYRGKNRYTPEDEGKILERFYSKTVENESTGCIEWVGALTLGYGSFGWNGRVYRAHRIAWAMEYGDPPSHMKVCHHCDNSSCVNIFHLFIGTQADNMRDMTAKGRRAPISPNRTGRKFSDDDVRYIRSNPEGMTRYELSCKFGISSGYLAKIISGSNRPFVS